MIAGVADTHAAIWHLFDDDRLSATAKRFIDEAAVLGQRIMVSTISLVEVVYLIEKNRFPASVYDDLKEALSDPDQSPKVGTVERRDCRRHASRAKIQRARYARSHSCRDGSALRGSRHQP